MAFRRVVYRFEAMPPILRRSLTIERVMIGKAEPSRTEGGKAAKAG